MITGVLSIKAFIKLALRWLIFNTMHCVICFGVRACARRQAGV